MEQKSKCPLCNGSGIIISEEGNSSEVARPCECSIKKYQETRLVQLYDAAHFPKGKIRDVTLDDYLSLPFPTEVKKLNEKNISIYTRYYNNISDLFKGPHVLWIYGEEPNACHTTLAVILGKQAIAQNYKVMFLSMQDLINIFFNFETLYSRLEKLFMNDIIIIDDIFDLSRCSINQKTSKFILSHTFNFFNDLISKDKRIICTSYTSVQLIDEIFSEIKILLLRSIIQLEFKGSISTYLQRINSHV